MPLLSPQCQALPFARQGRLSIWVGRSVALLGMVGIGWGQAAIAQSTANLTFVLTRGANATVHHVPGYTPRYSGVVGSGELLMNAQRQITGYYFTLNGLETNTRYVYHFHRALNGSTPTSCEGDKELVRDEAPGEVALNLGPIAPLRPNFRGYAFVGSAMNPVQLPEPVAISDIGYINIHPVFRGEIDSGIICANVRLDPGGLVR